MQEQPDAAVSAYLRKAAAEAARELGLRLVVLFGSTARSEARPGDLDLAVLADHALDPVDLVNYFTVLLGRNDVDVVDLRRADPVLLMQVAREGVPLFEQDVAEFNAFYSLAVRRFADTRKFREAEEGAIRDFISRRVLPS
jgi:uncharacterized protein